MANTVIINGDNRKFTISPEIKRYALIDAGSVSYTHLTLPTKA